MAADKFCVKPMGFIGALGFGFGGMGGLSLSY